jgi:hypothetical protein
MLPVTVVHHVKILTISFLIVTNIQIAFLNLDNVSRLRTERLRLFHSLTVAETKESLVKDSLQNGTIISLPFRRG